jgi:hypothetical protein
MLVTLGFWLAFVATLVALVVALLSGLLRKRRVHLVAGPLTIALLVVAVILTEELVAHFVFPPAEMRIHLTFAIAAGCLALAVAASGGALVWLPKLRRLHRYCVFAFVVMALLATGTGIWVFSIATPK